MLNRHTLFITGASRGIGLAIACRAARDGANVALAAKTATPHPRLPGTIYTAAEAVEAAGGKALPLILDVRDEQAVRAAMAATAKQFGGIHVLNNSPPLDLSPHWFGPHVAYSIAKFGMSLCTLGHAEEFRRYGIAVNSIWPISTIDTAAVRTHLANLSRTSRKPEIMADAAHAIISKPPVAATWQFYL